MFKRTLAFGLLMLILVSASILVAQERKSKPYEITPDGRIKGQDPKVKFTNCTVDKKELGDNLILLKGKCTWADETGAADEPAFVPINLYRPFPKAKKLRRVATYYTESDGSYYFVTRDIEGDYMIGPVTSRATNMPDKVREFFKERGKPDESEIH